MLNYKSTQLPLECIDEDTLRSERLGYKSLAERIALELSRRNGGVKYGWYDPTTGGWIAFDTQDLAVQEAMKEFNDPDARFKVTIIYT